MIKLGERIKELRLRDGRTQEALANERDGAFEALDQARMLAERSDTPGDPNALYSSPLLQYVKTRVSDTLGTLRAELPELWPWWDVPARDRVSAELQADPRWQKWAERCQ